MARHDFRFAVDGLDLTDDESAKVAAAVQAAGLEAIASLGRSAGFGISVGGGDGSEWINKYKVWRGYWILDAAAINVVLPGLEKAGVLNQLQHDLQR